LHTIYQGLQFIHDSSNKSHVDILGHISIAPKIAGQVRKIMG